MAAEADNRPPIPTKVIFAELADDDVVTIPMACEFLGGTGNPISPATYYRGVNRGIFPRPVHHGKNISRVVVGELRACRRKAMEAR